ncbi:NADH-quinone oxidoreductase subunit N [Glycomyces sp. NRRL B-16210]|uniref:NADH-quinone oxidoreductase subunit N n=1 Tax=Glycomyces sp. NRRL B-16210 TaxID=1463821 RepID=UPI00042F4DD5|nr:proton-conducting transporter membrane subunit [Glycomyces sp. NRRL B-16210]AHL24458.1 NADH-ubiquinone oxidoreductase chain N [Glycomyces sp. NRRL B-16210]
MRAQTIDHVALLPLYLAAGAAVLGLFGGRFAKAATMIGLAASGAAAVWVGVGADRATFAVGEWHSYVADDAAMGAAALFVALAVLVAALSGRQTGEYWFLLAVSAAGGVALAGSRDLITLVVAVETLTLPLYVLVTKPGRAGAEAGVTFLIASVTSSATALMGAALLYAAGGTVHLGGLAAGLDGAHHGLVAAGIALLLGGLAFKLAAAPLHAWAPLVLERAPLPVATYLASASKLGGAVAIIWVVHFGLAGEAGAGIVLAVLSVASIAVGNLGALAQRRTVPLLAWSGVAHAGYVLAPLAVVMTAAGRAEAATAASAAFAYAVFFVLLEAGAFAALTAVRPGSGALLGAGPDERGTGRDGRASSTETRGSLADGERRTPEAALQSGGPQGSVLKARAGNVDSIAGELQTTEAVSEGSPEFGDAREASMRTVVRGTAADAGVHDSSEGGSIEELSGLWRSAPLPASVFLLAVIGLAGLPPALAGTFAKIAVLEVLASSAVWLAVVVAAGAVLGLAYYLPLARAVLLGRASATGKGRFAIGVAVVGLAIAAVSLAPQLVLEFTSFSR